MLKRLFWSTEQHRPQAFWRILITALLMALPLFAAGCVFAALISADLRSRMEMNAALTTPGPTLTLLMLIVTGGLMVATWITSRWIDRRRWADLGFHFDRSWWICFAFGLGLGAVLMSLIFAAEVALGWIDAAVVFAARGPGTFALDFLLATVLFVAVGVYEELLYRGVLIKNIAEGTRAVNPQPRAAVMIAYLVTSALFGLVHAFNDNATVISTINIALAGLMLGLPYILTGELAISIGLHISWNLFQGNVFGFPVSGGTFAPPSVIVIQQKGPELFTGGAFGPEAGLIGVAAMLLGAALTLGWLRWQEGRVALSEAVPTYIARDAAPTVEASPAG